MGKKKESFGIVQGRLTQSPKGHLQWFPQNQWREEFHLASSLNIDFIELLTEREYNDLNPIWTKEGRDEIRAIAKKYDRSLYSICTDYIINHGLISNNSEKAKDHVKKFLNASMDLGCSVAVLPLLEKSNLTEQNINKFVLLIKEFANQIKGDKIILCLETLLKGLDLKIFLERVNEPNVKCVFDTGNRVIYNTDLASEIEILKDWVGHVHLKDKNILGENVLIGTGLVNFLSVFSSLKKINYNRSHVFETTRGSNPFNTANFHINACSFYISETNCD